MTAVAEDRRSGVSRGTPPPTGRVVLALARVEGGRLVRHPLVLIGAAMGAWALWFTTWDSAPKWPELSVLTGGMLIPLAAATLLAANLAALRARRHGTVELETAQPVEPWQRTVELQLAVLGAVLLAVALLLAVMASVVTVPAVGTPRPADLATGPVIVLLCGIIGIARARLPRAVAAAAAPLALVALAALEYWPASVAVSGPLVGWAWLVPWRDLWDTEGFLAFRPSRWHLVYLLAVTALAGLAAFRGYRGRRVAAGVCALALTVTAALIQARPPTRSAMKERLAVATGSERTQVCQRHGSVRYCANRDYQPWTDWWRAPVEGVLAAVPPRVAARGLKVRQLDLGTYFRPSAPPPATSRCRAGIPRLRRARFSGSHWLRPPSPERRQPGMAGVAGGAAVLVLAFLLASGILQRTGVLSRLSGTFGTPEWALAHRRGAMIGVVALVVLHAATRDPAAPRLRSFLRRPRQARGDGSPSQERSGGPRTSSTSITSPGA